ncbi:unnamed protein product [Kuraishia capsulata CBS 1993]|uniref:BAH domain-containing protein n=1 Tax=Kuraishia capsulata CBS 1993 TaxID=1382522 RepID=W6MV70_9ASCO|nr:uncharacterized protein KUCA_T00002076001 [Kuraishia capsulata CBS 1993]CDK26105.1 unnamed protein product [Kuraishia capsulata CBS 1993]
MSGSNRARNEQLSKRLFPYFNKIYDLKDANQVPVADVFQILPPRSLSEYYKVIRRPMSLQKVKISLNQQRYSSAEQFVYDLAQVSWNARFFNMKGSPIYEHAVLLENYVRNVMVPNIRNDNRVFGFEKVGYPDLGALPEEDTEAITSVVDSPSGPSGSKRGMTPFDEGDDDDEDEDDQLIIPRASTPQAAGERERRDHWENWIKRGRPPIIDKPHEQRIKTIMKGLKKLKSLNGDHFLYLRYDRLPNPSVEPDFYRVVKNPLSFNEVKAKIKQRLYETVEAFLADVSHVIGTYKQYYSEDPTISKELQLLQEGTSQLVSEEMAKPDSAYLHDSGNVLRVPLDAVKVQGRNYVVGDWVLLRNPNDDTKPIIGQIFRIWSTPQDGNNRWVNVCWYYRPEQTVHRVDRLFYENEVFKSAQYRDHLVEDIVGPCYVAYFSKYQRGDPAFRIDGPFFICEYRYNDMDRNFNKIKTWKGCIPDVVRNKEENYTPIAGPRNLQRVESPLRHMLLPNARETDPVPEPTVANLNAPPLIGGVYLRPAYKDDEPGVYLHTVNPAMKPHARHSASPAPGLINPPPASTPQPISQYNPVAASPSPYNYGVSTSTQYTPSRLINSPYNQVNYPVNNYLSSSSSSLTISSDVERELVTFAKSGLTRMDTANHIRKLKSIDPNIEVDFSLAEKHAPLIWLRGPPTVVANRLVVESNEQLNRVKRRKLLPSEDDVEVESYDAIGGGFGGERLGHSMEYLKWKLKL